MRAPSMLVALVLAWSLAGHAEPSQAAAVPGLPAWKPCVVVHSPGGIAEPIQFQAIDKLQRAGAMTWIRLNAYEDGSALPYYLISASMGLRIFSIIHRRDLDRMGWHEAFDSIYKKYHQPGLDPRSEIFEIAGEVSNPDPYVNESPTTPAVYMEKFKDLYAYVRRAYPDVILASAPPLGSGNGPEELEEFIKLGLLDMDIVVALNLYTEFALTQYAAVFTHHSAAMARRKVWVTETGVTDPGLQIDWVKRVYPKIQNSLRPEMICYYVLWAGDGEGGSGATKDDSMGLLSGVETGPYTERPLYRALTGALQEAQ